MAGESDTERSRYTFQPTNISGAASASPLVDLRARLGAEFSTTKVVLTVNAWNDSTTKDSGPVTVVVETFAEDTLGLPIPREPDFTPAGCTSTELYVYWCTTTNIVHGPTTPTVNNRASWIFTYSVVPLPGNVVVTELSLVILPLGPKYFDPFAANNTAHEACTTVDRTCHAVI